MHNLFYENLIYIPIISLLVSIFLKGLFISLKTKKIDLDRAISTGGMPSVHSCVVVSLTTAIAIKHGIYSDQFALAITFTLIIIYDAINVRFEAGRHAAAINKSIGEKKFKESLGHLPSEALAGSLLGVFIALGLYFF